MERIKRSERLAAISRILIASPNRLFTLSGFAEMFGTARSTVSEDLSILSDAFEQFEV